MTEAEFLGLQEGDKILFHQGEGIAKGKILNIRTEAHDGINQSLRAKVAYGYKGSTGIHYCVRPEDIICKVKK